MVTVVNDNFLVEAIGAIRHAGFSSYCDSDDRVRCFDSGTNLHDSVQRYRTSGGKSRLLNTHREAEHGRHDDPQIVVLKAAEFLRFHINFQAALHRGRAFARSVEVAP